MGLHYFIVSMVFSRCPNWKIFNFLDLKENQTGSNWTLLSVHQLNLWMFSNSVAFVTASAKAVVSWAGMKRNDAWQILKRRERERECVKKSYFSSCPTIFCLWTLEFPKKNSWFPLKPIKPCEWDNKNTPKQLTSFAEICSLLETFSWTNALGCPIVWKSFCYYEA